MKMLWRYGCFSTQRWKCIFHLWSSQTGVNPERLLEVRKAQKKQRKKAEKDQNAPLKICAKVSFFLLTAPWASCTKTWHTPVIITLNLRCAKNGTTVEIYTATRRLHGWLACTRFYGYWIIGNTYRWFWETVHDVKTAIVHTWTINKNPHVCN